REAQEILDVALRARCVDRGADRADEREREVEQRPLERRAAEDAEHLALAHAEREEAVRELLDGPVGLCPGDLAPVALDLLQVGGPRAAFPRRVLPQPRNRALGGHLARNVEALRGEGIAHSARIRPVPTRISPARCGLPGTDPSASASSTSPWGSPPRRLRAP